MMRTALTEEHPGIRLDRGRSCRQCEFFVRVDEPGSNRGFARRGFCAMGAGDADFKLYLSSSEAAACPSYRLDPTAEALYQAEAAMNARYEKFFERVEKEWERARKKEGRAPDPMEFFKIRSNALTAFIRENREDYHGLRAQVRLKAKEWRSLMDGVRDAIRREVAKRPLILPPIEGGSSP